MYRYSLIFLALGMAVTTRLEAQIVQRGQNLCYNGDFSAKEDGLDGWTYDYRYAKISHYMGNHTRVSRLATYKGYQGVLLVNGSSETKVECKPIKFEQGARYRCTLDLNGTTSPHVYFTGYKWNPGIRPHEDPHIGDLRRIYKSQFRGHKVKKGSNGWKRVSFEFPLENASELSLKHLRYVRFITVYAIAIADAPGKVYIDNVKVERIK